MLQSMGNHTPPPMDYWTPGIPLGQQQSNSTESDLSANLASQYSMSSYTFGAPVTNQSASPGGGQSPQQVMPVSYLAYPTPAQGGGGPSYMYYQPTTVPVYPTFNPHGQTTYPIANTMSDVIASASPGSTDRPGGPLPVVPTFRSQSTNQSSDVRQHSHQGPASRPPEGW